MMNPDLTTFSFSETCVKLTCPVNSTCKDISPDICRCQLGEVYVRSENRCKGGYLIAVSSYFLGNTHNLGYNNSNSDVFATFAENFETAVEKLIKDIIKINVMGVQLIEASKNMVVKLLVVYNNDTETTRLINSLQEHLVSAKSQVVDILKDFKVNRNMKPMAIGKY